MNPIPLSTDTSHIPTYPSHLSSKGGGATPLPVLARCWGTNLQLLQVEMVPASSGAGGAAAGAANGDAGNNNNNSRQQQQQQRLVPEFKVVQSFETSTGGAAQAVEWLGTSVLGWLDEAHRLHLVDSMSLVTLEVVDVAAVQPVFATYIRSHASTSDPIETPPPFPSSSSSSSSSLSTASKKKKHAVSFLNSLRACDGKLFVLGQTALRVVRVQSWEQRVDALVDDGEWLEALALALDHYESSIKPFEVGSGGGEGGEGGEGGKADGAGSGGGSGAAGVGGVGGAKPSSPSMAVQVMSGGAGEPKYLLPAARQIADLLLRYLKLAVENAPTAVASSSSSSSMQRIDLVQSHYQMIAGVCIEFCVVTGRLDLLFGTVFNQFVAANQARTILDLLEPYILREKVRQNMRVMHARMHK
jgi:hypothetical protein